MYPACATTTPSELAEGAAKEASSLLHIFACSSEYMCAKTAAVYFFSLPRCTFRREDGCFEQCYIEYHPHRPLNSSERVGSKSLVCSFLHVVLFHHTPFCVQSTMPLKVVFIEYMAFKKSVVPFLFAIFAIVQL